MSTAARRRNMAIEIISVIKYVARSAYVNSVYKKRHIGCAEHIRLRRTYPAPPGHINEGYADDHAGKHAASQSGEEEFNVSGDSPLSTTTPANTSKSLKGIQGIFNRKITLINADLFGFVVVGETSSTPEADAIWRLNIWRKSAKYG